MFVYIKADGTVTLSKEANKDLLIQCAIAFKTSIIDEGLDLIKFENIKTRWYPNIQTFSIPIIDLV